MVFLTTPCQIIIFFDSRNLFFKRVLTIFRGLLDLGLRHRPRIAIIFFSNCFLVVYLKLLYALFHLNKNSKVRKTFFDMEHSRDRLISCIMQTANKNWQKDLAVTETDDDTGESAECTLCSSWIHLTSSNFTADMFNSHNSSSNTL